MSVVQVDVAPLGAVALADAFVILAKSGEDGGFFVGQILETAWQKTLQVKMH